MKTIWNWLKSLFTNEKIGVVWRTIFTAAKSTLAQMVSDPDNQSAALALVKQLATSGMTNEQKRAAFEQRNAHGRAFAPAVSADTAVNGNGYAVSAVHQAR